MTKSSLIESMGMIQILKTLFIEEAQLISRLKDLVFGKNKCSFIFKKYSPDPVWGTWQSSPGAIKSMYKHYRE